MMTFLFTLGQFTDYTKGIFTNDITRSGEEWEEVSKM